MKILDRVLSSLLILGGIGHTIGSIKFYKSDPMTLLWALCASLFVFLFAAISLVRAGRPADTTLALDLPGRRPMLDRRFCSLRSADR